MKNNQLFILALLACAFSCFNCRNSTNSEVTHFQDGKFVIRTFYKDGGVRAEQMFNANGTLDGASITYYQNGNIKNENLYVDGKKNGTTKSFFEDGKLKYIGSLIDDEKDSTWLWYEQGPDGSHLDAIENFLNGKLFGGQIGFDNMGNLEWYKLFSTDGLLGRITFKDISPNIEGKLCFFLYNKDTLKKGSEFSSIFFVGTPPGWSSNMEVFLSNNDKYLFENKLWHLSKMEEWNADKYVFSCQMEKSGSYLLQAALQILNEENNIMYIDTLNMEIVVR